MDFALFDLSYSMARLLQAGGEAVFTPVAISLQPETIDYCSRVFMSVSGSVNNADQRHSFTRIWL
ncbi:MAG: hypothetical protein HOI16_01940 [Actinobacteria bacterium]|nr:hypothetical protein [Actinomycetota bacterium]MBT5806039.1 hypothetical protein [Actinomycetota bacterium]